MIKRRGRIVGAVLVLCFIVLVARLAQLQVFQHGEWAALAASIQERTVELDPRRGAIYDRNGMILAFDVKATAIAVDSYNMTKPVTLSQILSEELGIGRDEVDRLIYRPSYFTWIDRKVDLETAERIRERADAGGVNGLIFIDTWRRCYPQGDLASNLIGFVGVDGRGLEGVELEFDDVLSGTPTEIRVVRGKQAV
jgi:cell division protein FtsI/penicillin-binding protein 2